MVMQLHKIDPGISFKMNQNIPKFKILMIGMGGVGKTSYLTRFLTGEFREKYYPTIGCETNEILFHTNYGPILLDFWEPGGLIRDIYFPGSRAAIIMFDFESRITYKNVPNFYREITRVCDKIPVVILGNKIDLPDERRKLKVDKVLYHRKIGALFYTISVRKMLNLERPLLHLISQLIGRDDVKFVEDPAVPPPPPPMIEGMSMRTEEMEKKLAEALALVPLPEGGLDDEDKDEEEKVKYPDVDDF